MPFLLGNNSVERSRRHFAETFRRIFYSGSLRAKAKEQNESKENGKLWCHEAPSQRDKMIEKKKKKKLIPAQEGEK